MWRFFYTSLLLICQPLILCFIGLLSVKSPRYRQRLAERYGFYGNVPCPPPQGIFIHAASVGEVIAAIPLVRQLQQDYPHLSITFTTFYANRFRARQSHFWRQRFSLLSPP